MSVRSWFACALIAGCGAPPEDPVVPPPEHRTVVVTGDASTHEATPPEETRDSCAVEQVSPGGTSFSWRREVYVDVERPLFVISGPPTAAFTQPYFYDSSGRIISFGSVSFAYDGDVMSTGSSDLRYRLDEQGRVLSLFQGSTGTEWYRYTYDANGRCTDQFDSTPKTTAPTAHHYEYDDLGFLTSELSTSTAFSCKRAWKWSHGPIERVTVSDGDFVRQECTYHFDADDRLLSATCSSNVASWSYGTNTMTIAHLSGSAITSLDHYTGKCATVIDRKSLPSLFVPTASDPRPSRDQRVRLQASAIPVPYRECDVPPFIEDGALGPK